MTPIKAVAIYGDTTKAFPFVWLMLDMDTDIPTAYGFKRAMGPIARECYICGNGGCDWLTEHGATGSPAEGVPVHMSCQLDGDGILVATSNITWVEEEPPSLTPHERELLRMAVTGYRSICEDMVTRVSGRDWQGQLRVWDSLIAKLDLK